MEGAYLIEVSRRIKEYRLEKRLTVQELADRSRVSKGLISQIENGRSIPSLPVLFGIIQSLEIAISVFFEGLGIQKPGVIVQKKADYEHFTKEDAIGFSYSRIFVRNIADSALDFVLLELDQNAKRGEVTTEAFEYKYIIQGSCRYLIDGETYLLEEGDSLFFDGRLPHVPENTGTGTCRMLIVYFFYQSK